MKPETLKRRSTRMHRMAKSHAKDMYNVLLSKRIEELAEIEHEQWRSWIHYIMDNYELPPGLKAKWNKNDIPYAQLTEDVKELDRIWARRTIQAIQKELTHEEKKQVFGVLHGCETPHIMRESTIYSPNPTP